MAAVAFPILGADWLHNFRLLVDLYGMRLLPRGGGRGLQLVAPGSGHQYAAVGVIAQDVDNIRAYPGDGEFPGSPGAPTRESSKHVGVSSFSGREENFFCCFSFLISSEYFFELITPFAGFKNIFLLQK
jgi:hypothetical protein